MSLILCICIFRDHSKGVTLRPFILFSPFWLGLLYLPRPGRVIRHFDTPNNSSRNALLHVTIAQIRLSQR